VGEGVGGVAAAGAEVLVDPDDEGAGALEFSEALVGEGWVFGAAGEEAVVAAGGAAGVDAELEFFDFPHCVQCTLAYNRRMDKKPAGGTLIWERMQRTVRAGSKVSYEGLVAAAVRVADAEGLEAISMRRLAEELGTAPMSLYRYVETKDDVLDLMLDSAYGEMEIPGSGSGHWRRDLRGLAKETRRVLKRHAWLAPLVTARPTLGPNYLRWFEASLAALKGTGLEFATRVRLVGTLNAYVHGVVGYELGEAETNRRHGLDAEKKRAAAGPYLEKLLGTGAYPQLAKFVAEQLGDEPTDEDFEFGLECVLGGLSRVVKGKELRATS